MFRKPIFYVRLSALLSVLLLFPACDPGSSKEPGTDVKPAPMAQFKTATTLQQTMEWVLDPAADHIWDSAGSILTAEGTEELAPTTEEGWNNVRNSAAIVAQTGNLLMMPDHAMGQNDWTELSRGLIDAGMLAIKAAEDQDADALFAAGGQIYNVCRACHQQYVNGE